MLKAYFSRVKVIAAVILCLLIGISIWFGKTTASTQQFHQKNIDYLETKRDNAKALSGSASATSVVISLLPEDTATPIANQIANIGTQFLIILSALTAEQNLLLITGEISFCWLIPISLVFLILFAFLQRKLFLQLGVKLLICAVVIVLMVPLSIQITRMADASYQETVDETLEHSKELEDAIQGKSTPSSAKAGAQDREDNPDGSGAMQSTSEAHLENLAETAGRIQTEAASETDTEVPVKKTAKQESKSSKKEPAWYESAWDSIAGAADTVGTAITGAADTVNDTAQDAITGMSEFADDAADFAQDTADQVTDTALNIVDGVNSAADSTVSFVQSIPDLPERAAQLLDDFTDAFVIMMVTTCVLPIFIMLGCLWIMNMLLNIDPDWDGAKLYRSAKKSRSHVRSHSEDKD